MGAEPWGSKGPSIEELAAGSTDMRGSRRQPTAIIIPTASGGEKLERHLDLLEKQSLREFDVIVVHPESARPAKRQGVLYVREKTGFRSAGAFYLGEKIALRDGYSRIILADDDCLPVSKNLVETLVRSHYDIAIPRKREPGGARAHANRLIHHYGCISAGTFRKSGLTFLPLRFGGEDTELLLRMESPGGRLDQADSVVEHVGMGSAIGTPPDKTYYYQRGNLEATLLTCGFFDAYSVTAISLLKAAGYATIGQPALARVLVRAVADGVRMDLSRDASHAYERHLEETVPGDGAIIIPEAETSTAGDSETVPRFPATLGRQAAIISGMRHCFNREVYFERILEREHFPAVMIAKRSYTQVGQKTIALGRERGAVRILAGLVFLGFALPAAAAASFILTAYGFYSVWKKGLRTRRYGIE